MIKSFRLLLLSFVLISALVFAPVTTVHAVSFPAEINKSFTPDAIVSGDISKLRVSIYNPNSFQLTDAAWTDNLPAGITIVSPLNVTQTCSGSVAAVGGGTVFSLSAGIVPPQVGSTPGTCYVEIDVTSTTTGNLINTIGVGPVNGLSAKGNDGGTIVDITNTTPASATLNVVGVSAPTLSKSFAPNTIFVGGTSVLTINVKNNDVTNTLTQTTLTDNLPTGLELATPVNATLTNCGPGTVTGNPGDPSLTLNNASIAPGATCTIMVNITSVVQGAYTNTIPAGPGGVGSIQTRQGVTNGTPANANLNVQAFTVSKAFGASPIPAGGTSVLTISIQNHASFAYTGVDFYDDLPAGNQLEYVPGTETTTCTSGSETLVTSTVLPSTVVNRVRLTNGTVPASTTCIIQVTVRARQSATGTYTNTVPAGRLTTTQGATYPVVVTANLNVTGLSISKNMAAATIPLGGTTTLTITITNPSPSPYTITSLLDDLSAPTDSRLSIAAVPAESTTCIGGVIDFPTARQVRIQGGTIPALGSCTITITVVGSTAGNNRVNTIPAGGLTTVEGGTNAAPATDTINITSVVPTVTKSFGGGANTLSAGGSTSLAITITNPAGAVALNNLGLVDDLASTGTGLQFTSLTSNTCGGLVTGTGTQVITLSGGLLAAGASSCVITVQVTMPLNTNGATYTNTILQSNFTNTEGIGIAGNVTRTLTVRAVDLASKSFTPSTFQSGGTSSLVITLQNFTATPLTVATLTDNLAAPTNSNLSIAAYPPATAPSTTCVGGVVTATAGTQSIQLASGTIPAGTYATPGTCTVTVPVTGTLVGGPYTNTIPIGNLTTVEGPTSQTARTANITIYTAGTGVTLTKTFGTNPINAGANSLMTLTISAPADATLTSFSITDTFPTNMVVGNPPNAAVVSGCGALSFSPAPTAGDGFITASGGTITPGTNCVLRVNVTGNLGGAYVNRIRPVNITNDQIRSIAADVTQTLNVNTVSTLVVTKNFQPPVVHPNGSSTLTIYLENSNTSALINASVLDSLPQASGTDGVVVAPIPNASTTCGVGGVITANVGATSISMANGTIPARVGAVNGTCSIKVDVQGKYASAALPATYNNNIPIANVTATNQDTLETMRSTAPAAATLTVQNLTMEVVKKFDPQLVYGGSVSTLSITLRNPNPSAALTGIAFTDTMPVGMILANPVDLNVGACGGTLSGIPGASTFSYSGGSLPAATECKLTLKATLTVNGNLTNTIPIGAVTTFNGVSNTTATAASLTNLAGAGITKGFAPNPIIAGSGDYSLLTITINNTNPTLDLTQMGLVDTLPVGLEIAAAPASINNCSGTLDAAAGTRHIELTNGTLLRNSSCTLLIPVIGATPGVFTNTIPANTLTTFESRTNLDPAVATLTLTGFSLGNRVWDDNGAGGGTFNDGIRNGAEPGIDGVTVNLYRDSNNDGTPDGAVIATTTTAGGGFYRFDNLAADTYIVEVVTPTGYTSTVDAGDPDTDVDDDDDNGVVVSGSNIRSNPVTLGPTANEPTGENNPVPNPGAGEAVDDQSNRTVDFGFITAFSLGNRVWDDNGAGGGTADDGVRNGTEPGIDGVTVNLYRDSNNDGAPDGASIATTTTAGGGFYRFDNLIADTYIVEVVTPTGYTSSSVDAGDPDTDVDDDDDNGVVVSGSNIRSNPVTLGPTANEPTGENNPVTNPEAGEAVDNQSNRTVDFGFYFVPYSLGNRVWEDNGAGIGGIANDGVRNGAEPGIDGVTVNLYRDSNNDGTPDGASIATTTTAGGGFYRFDNLMTDTYIVEVVTPTGYTSTVDAGDPDTDVDDDDDNGVVVSGNNIRSNPVTLGPGASEPTGENNPPTNPEAGEAADDHSNRTVDFGFITAFSLGNRVWDDNGAGGGTADDGVRNGTEPGIDGVTVNLYRDSNNDGAPDGASIATTTTAGGGFYRFDNLIADTYIVEVVTPTGYTSSSVDAGDPDTDVDDDDDNGVVVSGSNIRSNPVTLGPTANEPTGENNPVTNPEAGEAVDNQSNRTVDFGFYFVPYSLGNRVWEDNGAGIGGIANDGVRNGAEPGIDGVTVNLYRDSNNDGTPDGASIATTTTAGGGFYRFDNLMTDTYIVEVVTPTGYTSTVDAGDPDTDVDDDDDNGVVVSGNNIRSNPVTLGPGASEPTGENNPPTNPEAGEAADDHSNRTVDFGFIVNVASIGMEKIITGTSETFTTGNNVAIGEIVTYQITMNLPIGLALDNVVVTDRMDKGLAFVDCVSINLAGTDITSSVCPPTVSAITDPGNLPTNPANPGRQVQFNIGNVTAPATASTLVIQYRAIVLDVIENQETDELNNSVTLTWTGGSLTASAPDVTIVEPDLAIDKSATPTTVTAGDSIQFTLTISHTALSSTDAFDVVVTDVLPDGLEYIACTPITYSGVVPTTQPDPCNIPGGNTLTFGWDSFPLNQSATIVLFARFDGTKPSLINIASVSWTSLPIDFGPGGNPVELSTYNDTSTERWYDPNDLADTYQVIDGVGINMPAGEEEEVDLPSGLPATGFAPNVITALPEQPAEKSYAATDVWLEIPSLGVNIPIVGVPLVEDDWDVSWLWKQAGWLNGTAFPGWQGNSALTGHVTLPNGKSGPFVGLGKLKWGDKILVHAYGSVYTYEVRQNRTVSPNNTSVLKHEDDAWLTLITCKTYNEETNTYARRIAVRATLVSVELEKQVSTSKGGR